MMSGFKSGLRPGSKPRWRRHLTVLGGAAAVAAGLGVLSAGTAEAAPDLGSLPASPAGVGPTGLATIPGAASGTGDGSTGSGGSGGADPADVHQTCDDGVCLTMGQDNPADWHYGGFRPFFDQWQTTTPQDYIVQVPGADGSTIDAGHYGVTISDTYTPMVGSYVYTYGDFVPNPAAAADDPDLGIFGDLSGAKVSDTVFLNGAASVLTIDNVGPDHLSYIVNKVGDFTTTMVIGDDANATYVQTGDGAPQFLWNTFDNPSFNFAAVPDEVIPADPYGGGPDFDPGDFAFGDVTDVGS